MDRRRCLTGLGALLPGLALPAFATSTAEQAGQAAGALAALEARTGGRLGVRITDGAGAVLLEHRADERFPMCSTFKLLAAAAVLRKVERGQETLEQRVAIPRGQLLEWSPVTEKHRGGMTVGELCAAALDFSDNTAANLLLDSLGGPAAVTAFARDLGDPVTRLDRREPEMNDVRPGDERDTSTPAAMGRTLRLLLLGDALGAPARQRLVAWLRDCRTGDDRLRAGLPPKTVVANKTGTGPYGTSNDIGIAWMPRRPPRVIVAYLNGARVDRTGQAAALAEVGRVAATLG